MLIYLDSNIVICLVEQPAELGPRASARVRALQAEGHRLAVSPLVRMECLVHPLAAADTLALNDYAELFQSTAIALLDMGVAVYDRAAEIRCRRGGLRPPPHQRRSAG